MMNEEKIMFWWDIRLVFSPRGLLVFRICLLHPETSFLLLFCLSSVDNIILGLRTIKDEIRHITPDNGSKKFDSTKKSHEKDAGTLIKEDGGETIKWKGKTDEIQQDFWLATRSWSNSSSNPIQTFNRDQKRQKSKNWWSFLIILSTEERQNNSRKDVSGCNKQMRKTSRPRGENTSRRKECEFFDLQALCLPS